MTGMLRQHRVVAQLLEHPHAAEVGHDEVEQHQAGEDGGRLPEAVQPVGGGDDGVALGLEQRLQQPAHARVVLDDEDAARRSRRHPHAVEHAGQGVDEGVELRRG